MPAKRTKSHESHDYKSLNSSAKNGGEILGDPKFSKQKSLTNPKKEISTIDPPAAAGGTDEVASGDIFENQNGAKPQKELTFAEVQEMKNKPVQIPPPTQKSPLPFPVPTVGMMSDKGTTAEDYQKAREFLKDMADRSGGRVYEASNGANLVDAFSKVAAELREYYSIGYTPKETSKNGKHHKIKVRVDRENLVVRAKEDFVIGKKEEESEK